MRPPVDWISDPNIWVALLTLTSLEIVLGIDNIVFISILVAKLPAPLRNKARIVGLSLAMFMRLALLLAIGWVIGLTAPLFEVMGQEISGRDLILLTGGLFLLGKATYEIHDKIEGHSKPTLTAGTASFGAIIIQIIALDAVFSLDSVITAVGMAKEVAIMMIAVIIAVGVMLVSARAIGEFVEDYPTVKMLALSFLLLIGMVLVAESLDQHIPKGYIYFAMGFAVFVEMLNLRLRRPEESRQITTAPVRRSTVRSSRSVISKRVR
jgi:predicted tellurium resistance membrane protein TerC